MRVSASLWLEHPGAYSDMTAYDSVDDVKAEFAKMVKDYRRYGGAKPTGIICRGDTDDVSHTLSVGPRGGIIVEVHHG